MEAINWTGERSAALKGGGVLRLRSVPQDLRREAEGRQQAEEYKARSGLDENEKPL